VDRRNWTYKKLGEVCDIICGQDYKKVESPDGKYPIYGTGGIMGYANQYKCPACSVIVGRKGSINNPIYVEEDFWNVDTAFGIVPSIESLFPKFFFYFCKSYDFTKHNVAVTIPSLRRIDLLKIPIPVPSLSEQERIVSELDLLSSIIEKKKAQLEEYDQLAQSIFYDMFGDPITNENGWEVKKLKDISQIGTGATPSREKEELYYGGDIHWVKTTEVHNCEITNTEETITQLAIEHTNCKIYPPNTLLMAMYGQGKTRGQIAKLKINAATNQACAAILLNERECNLEFIYCLLLIKYEDIRAMAQGGNQANLNMKIVGSIPIIIPPIEMQNLFAEKIEAIEKQKEKIKQSIKELETLFNSRMDNFFN
jgi:type I restriction enzyme S subunit